MSDTPLSISAARAEAKAIFGLVTRGKTTAAEARELIAVPARLVQALESSPSPFVRRALEFRRRVSTEFERMYGAQLPYPWCDAREKCIKLGYCPRNPNCGD